MMAKTIFLLLTIACPLVVCQDCPVSEYDGPGWGNCDCTEFDLDHVVDELVAKAACSACVIVEDISTKIFFPTGEAVDHSTCFTCDYVNEIADKIGITDECCQPHMELLLEQTDDADLLLGAKDYHHDHHSPKEDCVFCDQIIQLARNTECPLHKPNTCYLYGKSYNQGGYGGGAGSMGYDWPLTSMYNSGGVSYNNNYDYDMEHGPDYGHYGYYDQHECTYDTLVGYMKVLPNHCEVLKQAMINCPGDEPAHIPTTKSYEDEYRNIEIKYKQLYDEHQTLTTRCEHREYDTDTALAPPPAETNDKSVETASWVVFAISGAMLLASIVFFVTGRSERKAAAENRMAGHGVMA